MPVGPAPYWVPPRPRPPTTLVLVALVVVVLVLVFAAMFLMFIGADISSAVAFAPFCVVLVFMIVIVVVAIAAGGGLQRRTLPPPPPIQQPMVPAGLQGPVALTCPNCGAPPTAVDRFGVATCTYCGTRFIVR